MQKWLENKWTNTLNFEHTILLTENVVEHLLATHGFKIQEKQYFAEHSIFYNTKYDKTAHHKKTLPNEYKKIKHYSWICITIIINKLKS